MFMLFFTLFFLSLLTDVNAEENFNQHSSLEIIPKDYLLKEGLNFLSLDSVRLIQLNDMV